MDATTTFRLLALLAASTLAFGSGCLEGDDCAGDEPCEVEETDVELGGELDDEASDRDEHGISFSFAKGCANQGLTYDPATGACYSPEARCLEEGKYWYATSSVCRCGQSMPDIIERCASGRLLDQACCLPGLE